MKSWARPGRKDFRIGMPKSWMAAVFFGGARQHLRRGLEQRKVILGNFRQMQLTARLTF